MVIIYNPAEWRSFIRWLGATINPWGVARWRFHGHFWWFFWHPKMGHSHCCGLAQSASAWCPADSIEERQGGGDLTEDWSQNLFIDFNLYICLIYFLLFSSLSLSLSLCISLSVVVSSLHYANICRHIYIHVGVVSRYGCSIVWCKESSCGVMQLSANAVNSVMNFFLFVRQLMGVGMLLRVGLVHSR